MLALVAVVAEALMVKRAGRRGTKGTQGREGTIAGKAACFPPQNNGNFGANSEYKVVESAIRAEFGWFRWSKQLELRDEAVVDQVVSGDTAAFRSLVDRHSDLVFRFVSKIVGNQDAEDISQETFLSAFRALERFDARKAQFSTWLLSIARNKSLSFLRKRRQGTLDAVGLEAGGIEAIGHDNDPTVAAEQLEALQLLNQAIAALPVDQRSAFTLVEFEQLSYDQACVIEEVPLGTLKSRVNRAKSKLLSVLQKLELRAARRNG